MICRGCTIEFTPKREGQKYHNRKCYLGATFKLIKCSYCGVEFNKKFSKQICCSKKCSYLHRARIKTKGSYLNCALPSCGKQIYRMPSRVKKYNFCCHEHRAIYQKSPENKEFGKNWKHTPEAIEKIRKDSLNRNYNLALTPESRQKMALSAKNKVWTEESKEKLRLANIGKRQTKGHRLKIRVNARYGKDNYMWKGAEAKYPAIHAYIKRHIGTTKKCVICGKTALESRIELSNKDHKWSRNLSDWEWRCHVHHQQYELEHGLVHPTGKNLRFYAKFNHI